MLSQVPAGKHAFVLPEARAIEDWQLTLFAWVAGGTGGSAINASLELAGSAPVATSRQERQSWRLAALVLLHVVALCLSTYYVQQFYSYLPFVGFDKANLGRAFLGVAPFAAASLLFAVARFSFGYCLSFYLFNVALGYAWIAPFSSFNYDQTLATASVFLSTMVFSLPALFFSPKFAKLPRLSEVAFNRMLAVLLAVSLLILAVGATHRFRIVGIDEIYTYRQEVEFPTLLGYGIGMTVCALLPFLAAFFISQRYWLRAALACVILLLFYPITLKKLALLAPIWIIFVAVVSRFFNARISIILSMLLPIALGLATVPLIKAGILSHQHLNPVFGIANFRMMAVPSISLDLYSEFFASHPVTGFCQISFLHHFIDCPYPEPLAVVMEKAFHFGNLNASLFATEGIASVGLKFASLSAFVCGLVVALANGLSEGLPARFVLLSSGILLQSFVNIPFTTTLLTSGGVLLFVLWCVTPRSIFEKGESFR
jgi:hypothetical protein